MHTNSTPRTRAQSAPVRRHESADRIRTAVTSESDVRAHTCQVFEELHLASVVPTKKPAGKFVASCLSDANLRGGELMGHESAVFPVLVTFRIFALLILKKGRHLVLDYAHW